MGIPGFRPGDVIADKYEVERVIAQGGMGLVVAARHTSLEKQVAIKCLVRAEGLVPEEAANRFTREARAAASIESDYVCKVFDVGAVGATPYIVMEYLEGHDLEVELSERGRLPFPEAVDYMMQALDGLDSAHALGIVHRDLKPANLFLTRRPDGTRRVKILDFGISKVEGKDAKLTDTKGSFGTPSYMSPEQIKNAKQTDLRTDLWAVGAILHELVTGEPAFKGETSGEILAAVLEEKPAALDALVPGVPEGLARIVARCLMRDRDARFGGANEFALALAQYGTGAVLPKSASVPRLPVLVAVDRSASTVSESDAALIKLPATGSSGWTSASTKRSRRTVGLVLAAGAVVAIAVTVGIGASRARIGGDAAASLGPSAVGTPAAASTGATNDSDTSGAKAVQLALSSAPPPSAPAVQASARPAAPTASLRARAAAPPARPPPVSRPTEKKSKADILKDSY